MNGMVALANGVKIGLLGESNGRRSPVLKENSSLIGIPRRGYNLKFQVMTTQTEIYGIFVDNYGKAVPAKSRQIVNGDDPETIRKYRFTLQVRPHPNTKRLCVKGNGTAFHLLRIFLDTLETITLRRERNGIYVRLVQSSGMVLVKREEIIKNPDLRR
ncbi:hypothetical protein A3F23_01555 [Candidatus Giovannonibacteria bacterium RIFCSPHIGHO2_12_FULL_43_15]|uniref:Uncharacterized protein n=1 Tax=Candidatus Giovannonibacteria bacterium RIFCSPHIGHO2_12_FULL_43_15 TaxID=1798341 RepID=A0A1F5WQ65_9BACT|nr:MAG: hypothetical protein A3F23_01555 [Candidatus Giovannonibacteria bacterium RIFCSPHIGHO2_12_FULL_43_15]